MSNETIDFFIGKFYPNQLLDVEKFVATDENFTFAIFPTIFIVLTLKPMPIFPELILIRLFIPLIPIILPLTMMVTLEIFIRCTICLPPLGSWFCHWFSIEPPPHNGILEFVPPVHFEHLGNVHLFERECSARSYLEEITYCLSAVPAVVQLWILQEDLVQRQWFLYPQLQDQSASSLWWGQ